MDSSVIPSNSPQIQSIPTASYANYIPNVSLLTFAVRERYNHLVLTNPAFLIPLPTPAVPNL